MVMSVVMNPGVTVLTVMPLPAVSRARLMVSPNIPDLAAAWLACPNPPAEPMIEEMLMIRP